MEVLPHNSIFLSASVPHRPAWIADAKPTEVEEAIISLARAIFARKGRLVFGGHPSISPLVASIAGEYFAVNPGRKVRPVIIFQSEYYRGQLPDETWELHRLGWADIVWTPTQLWNGVPDKNLSLAAMRALMIQDPARVDPMIQSTAWKSTIERTALAAPKAMVAIGGMEGVIDECAVFLEHHIGVPAYCYVSTGGASSRLLEREIQRDTSWLALHGHDVVGEDRIHRIQHARATGGLRAVEDDFNSRLQARAPDLLARGTPTSFQPYALMSQWLLDILQIRA